MMRNVQLYQHTTEWQSNLKRKGWHDGIAGRPPRHFSLLSYMVGYKYGAAERKLLKSRR